MAVGVGAVAYSVFNGTVNRQLFCLINYSFAFLFFLFWLKNLLIYYWKKKKTFFQKQFFIDKFYINVNITI